MSLISSSFQLLEISLTATQERAHACMHEQRAEEAREDKLFSFVDRKNQKIEPNFEVKDCKPESLMPPNIGVDIMRERSSVQQPSFPAKTSDRVDSVESGKSSIYRGSTSSMVSNESTCSSFSSAINKPHKANGKRWEAIQAVRSRDRVLGLGHFRLLKRLGCGDNGSVHLSGLSGTKCYLVICPGRDLYSLRQRQPGKHFPE